MAREQALGAARAKMQEKYNASVLRAAEIRQEVKWLEDKLMWSCVTKLIETFILGCYTLKK